MAMESHLVGQLQDQAAGEEEEIEDFDVIDKLQAFGIGAADIKKAKEGGCHTCQSLIMSTMKRLTAIKGLSEAKIEKMREAAKKVCSVGQWQTGAMVMQMRERDVVKITTGAAAIDELLGGGIETKSITEVYGEHRCGKTQLCLTMCVTTQLGEDMKGGAGKVGGVGCLINPMQQVAYIDTDGTFRPERIVPIADRFGLDAQAVLNNIFYARAFTHEHQMELVYSIAAKMVEEPFKLLIIDSIMAAFRVDFSGRGELADRQQKLGQMLNHLKKIAEEYNVAVVLTNQVMSDPGAGAMFVADPKKPLGGHVMAHAVTTRLSLRKGKAEQRLMKVVGSPYLAEAEASFAIGADGLNDYKD